MLSHSGFVWVNCGGMTSFGYVTPRTPGAIWTMSASPMKTRKITRPATAVLFAKKTLAESMSSSKRALCSKTVAMAFPLVPNSRIQERVHGIEHQHVADFDESDDER